MFDHEEAVKHQLILLLLGLDAYTHQVGDLGWVVWLESAGLQMFCADDVKGYLLLRWSAEQRAQEMLVGDGHEVINGVLEFDVVRGEVQNG